MPLTMYDVTIVGYGPVGATLGILLARHGLRIAVVEQSDKLYDKPRAITLDHEALRIFQACGLADAIDKETTPHPGTHFLGMDGGLIKVFDPLPRPYPLGWAPTATFIQPQFEKALRLRLESHANCDVFLSTTANEVLQDDDAVSLTVNSGVTGEDRVIRSRYLIACDGANSFVRKKLDMPLEDLAFDEWWMAVDALSADAKKRPNKSLQYCWPTRPGTYLPGPAAYRRWEFKLLPGEGPEDFKTPETILGVLKTFTDISDLAIWRSAVYRFHALLAEHWRRDRIFLMGDAAHQMPPFLGQGLCAGIRDASNLAWKLVRVIKGTAKPSLLDSYEVERKPHVRSIVASAKEFGLIIGELDKVAAEARDTRLREELRSGRAKTIRQTFIPDLDGGVIARGAIAAGSLFVQPEIRAAGGGLKKLDDLVSPGFLIVAKSPKVTAWMTPQALACWSALEGQVVIVNRGAGKNVSSGEDFQENESLLSDWLEKMDAHAVVVRPDRYVFGGAKNATELNALIGRVAKTICFDGTTADCEAARGSSRSDKWTGR